MLGELSLPVIHFPLLGDAAKAVSHSSVQAVSSHLDRATRRCWQRPLDPRLVHGEEGKKRGGIINMMKTQEAFDSLCPLPSLQPRSLKYALRGRQAPHKRQSTE
jgi:hypothetical protein